MGLPWRQVSAEIIEFEARDLAIVLGWKEASAGWGLMKLFDWAYRRCKKELPPSWSDVISGPDAALLVARAGLWAGDPEAYVSALERLPEPPIERLPNGNIRIRGLKRYDSAWKKANPELWAKLQAQNGAAQKPGPTPKPDQTRNETATEPEPTRTGKAPKPDRNRAELATDSDLNRTGTVPEPDRNRAGTGTEPDLNRAEPVPEPARKIEIEIEIDTKEKEKALAPDGAAAEGKPDGKRLKALTKLLVWDYADLRGGDKYRHQGAKDTEALKSILVLGVLDAEVRSRFRFGIRAKGWLAINTIAQLAQKWNDLSGYGDPPPPEADPPRLSAPENMNGAAEAMQTEVLF